MNAELQTKLDKLIGESVSVIKFRTQKDNNLGLFIKGKLNTRLDTDGRVIYFISHNESELDTISFYLEAVQGITSRNEILL